VQAAASLAVVHRHLITDSDEIGDGDLTALRVRGGAAAHSDDFGRSIDGERLLERSAAGLSRNGKGRSRERIDCAVGRFRALSGRRSTFGTGIIDALDGRRAHRAAGLLIGDLDGVAGLDEIGEPCCSGLAGRFGFPLGCTGAGGFEHGLRSTINLSSRSAALTVIESPLIAVTVPRADFVPWAAALVDASSANNDSTPQSQTAEPVPAHVASLPSLPPPKEAHHDMVPPARAPKEVARAGKTSRTALRMKARRPIELAGEMLLLRLLSRAPSIES
jgi:hypothetical protein